MTNSLRAQTREILNRYDVRPKKKLGQNFLIDQQLCEEIIKASELSQEDTVVEIGPGLGFLTRALCEGAGRVLSIELDGALLTILKREMKDLPNLSLVQGDALAFNYEIWAREQGLRRQVKVVANLPYYISTPLIFHLLRQRASFSLFVLMVQKEVADRILARPGSKSYGSLSIALQLYTDMYPIAIAPREAFYPEPQVDSVILKIIICSRPKAEIVDENLFRDLVRAAFSQRRKMLGNALPGQLDLWPRKEIWDRVFADAEISPRRRGETLDIEEFARLTCYLYHWREREGHVSHRRG
jgi:16S rRNA (adenine1518-N6/adenine1519-N6)-dimethyltransferase